MSNVDPTLVQVQPMTAKRLAAETLLALASVILGYATMVLGLVLVQDIWLGRIIISESPAVGQLVSVGIGSFLAAAAGGVVASLVWRRKNLIPHYAMSLLTAVEATAIYFSGTGDNPLWFDIIADGTLVAGIVIAGVIVSAKWSSRAK